MIMIPSKQTTAADSWIVGTWRDCQSQDSVLTFQDCSAAARWLLRLSSDELRRLGHRYGDGLALYRITDQRIADWLAGLILSGYLRVYRAGAAGADGVPQVAAAQGLAEEDKVMRRLRVTHKEFTFEGLRLRLIRADEWLRMHGSRRGRYQIVPRGEAERLLGKLSDWPMIGPDERTAVREAIALLPEMQGRLSTEGLLLVRAIPGAGTSDKSASGPVFSPSQLARLQRAPESLHSIASDEVQHADVAERPPEPLNLMASEEVPHADVAERPPEPPVDLHWIEIELLDAQDQPVPNETYRIELPDHSVRTGRLDADGRAYIRDIPVPGDCLVSFPEIDRREWWPA